MQSSEGESPRGRLCFMMYPVESFSSIYNVIFDLEESPGGREGPVMKKHSSPFINSRNTDINIITIINKDFE